MGKATSNGFIDGGLNAIRTSTRMTVLPSEPTSIADITANALAVQTGRTAANYVIANGDVSGRKVTMAAGTGLSITASGTATHVAHDNGTDFTVTTCTPQGVTSGGTLDVPAHDQEIADPT